MTVIITLICNNFSKWTFLIETQNNDSNALNGNDHVFNYDYDNYDSYHHLSDILSMKSVCCRILLVCCVCPCLRDLPKVSSISFLSLLPGFFRIYRQTMLFTVQIVNPTEAM